MIILLIGLDYIEGYVENWKRRKCGAPIEPPSLDISGNDDLDGTGNENNLIVGGDDETKGFDVTPFKFVIEN